MTIYDLTRAIVRYKVFLLIGLGVVVFAVLALTFELTDGAIGLRGGQTFESAFQISVVAPGTKSLSEPESGMNLDSVADVYADLLSTGEAAEGISALAGFQLDEVLSTGASQGSPIISGTVTGPSANEAIAAAESAFTWLAERITRPIVGQPQYSTEPVASDVALDAPFESSMAVVLDEGLSQVSSEVLLLVDRDPGSPMVIPVANRAGSTVTAAVILSPNGSIVVSLEGTDGTLYDVLQVVPDVLPASAPAYPRLEIRLGSTAIKSIESTVDDADETTETTWAFRSSAIGTEWIPGVPTAPSDLSETEQLQVAMLTEDPTAIQIGGRRGPLLGFTVLVVGAIVLLAAIVVADTWRRERDRQTNRGETPGQAPLANRELAVDLGIVGTTDGPTSHAQEEHTQKEHAETDQIPK